MSQIEPVDVCNGSYAGCAIPPEAYDIAFGWDPQPEIERLLFLARERGLSVNTALELGCGTGRLLAPLTARGVQACGLELSLAMAAYARASRAVEVIVGEIADFDLGRRFDLIHASANTIRHVTRDAAIQSMWRCIREHLVPGGVFIADLELGQAARSTVAANWEIARGDALVRARWRVVEPYVADAPALARIRWWFEMRRGDDRQTWTESFPLRCYTGAAFQGPALAAGLAPCGLYELREPHLLPRDPGRADGRFLTVFERASGAPVLRPGR